MSMSLSAEPKSHSRFVRGIVHAIGRILCLLALIPLKLHVRFLNILFCLLPQVVPLFKYMPPFDTDHGRTQNTDMTIYIHTELLKVNSLEL